MMMNNRDINHITHNEQGIAIIMVMTSITFLILILATFTYDTKVNKLRLYNQQERIQAKLNAESGLKFAMLRLEIYQKARNLLEQNKNLKDVLSPQLIQSILIMPFFYPIPAIGEMNLIQKTALGEFNDSVLLQGKLNFSIVPVSGFLNPNNMIEVSNEQTSSPPDDPNTPNDPKADKKANMAKEVERSIIQIFTDSIDQKRESNELFNSLYSNINPELLVKELKYYITPKGQFKDQELAQIQPLFDNLGIEPKHAPLSSIEELNLLPSWDDDLIELVKDHLTAQAQSVLNIEQITKKQLMAIFPSLTALRAEEYFEYRDGNDKKEIESHVIKSVARFEQVLTSTLSIIEPDTYKDAVTKLKEAGITLGVANLLFEVSSTGFYNRSQYLLKAIVSIPTLEKEIKPVSPKATPTPKPEDDEDGVFNPDGTKIEDNPNETKPAGDKGEVKKEIEYLAPRIEEISNG